MAKRLVPTWNKKQKPGKEAAETFLRKANLCMDHDDPRHALEFADKAIALDEQSVSALFVKGSALISLLRVQEALECYQSILAIDPYNEKARSCINILHFSTGLGDAGHQNFEKLIRDHPDDHHALFLYGKGRREVGDIEGALDAISRACKLNPDDLQYHLTYLQLLCENNANQECLTECEKILTRYGDTVQVLEIKAICLFRLGESEAGMTLLDKNIKLDPDPVRSHLAKAYLLFQIRRFQEAEAALLVIPKKFHTRRDVAPILGQVLLSQQKIGEAQLVIKDALSENNENPALLNLYSEILIAAGDLEQSLETLGHIEQIEGLSDLQLVRKLSLLIQTGREDEAYKTVRQFPDDPDDPGFLYNLALTAFNQDYSDAALLLANLFVTRFPDDPEGWTLLGGVCQESDLYDDTISAYSRALELDPDNYTALSMYIDYLTDNDEYDEALSLNEHRIEINRTVENLILQGWILGEMEDFSEAYDCFSALSAEFPDNEVVWLDLGWVNGELGKDDEACSAYLKALEINPAFGDAWYNLGAVYFRVGKYAESKEAFCNALSYLPEDPDCLEQYAEMLFAAGEFEEADTIYRQYLEMKPDDADAWFAVSDACYELGWYEKALSASIRGLDLYPNNQPGKRLKAKIEFRLRQG
ncbi:MAG: tetratricopeptide repeat protein [Methanobacteriota archaeon]